MRWDGRGENGWDEKGWWDENDGMRIGWAVWMRWMDWVRIRLDGNGWEWMHYGMRWVGMG